MSFCGGSCLLKMAKECNIGVLVQKSNFDLTEVYEEAIIHSGTLAIPLGWHWMLSAILGKDSGGKPGAPSSVLPEHTALITQSCACF